MLNKLANTRIERTISSREPCGRIESKTADEVNCIELTVATTDRPQRGHRKPLQNIINTRALRNDEVRRTTGHIARMPDETDARSIITASPSENWRRPPGRPRTTWMKTIQQDLRYNNLSLDEAITVAQNRPLWRLMSAFGATHP